MSEAGRQPDPALRAELREALLDQLAYFIDEVEALRAVIVRVPEALLAGRPLEGQYSVKEMYGLLATRDEAVYLPQFQAMAAEDDPRFEAIDEGRLVREEPWDTYPMEAILSRTQEARERLLAFLRALPAEAWRRTAVFGQARLTLFARVHQVLQEQTDVLRALGYRLHESHLAERPRDLPK